VLIPAHPGALSAVGILLADSVRDYSRTVMLPGSELPNLDALFQQLEAQANELNLAAIFERSFERSLDLRYRGQGYELNIPFSREADDPAARFHSLHAQRYGFSNPSRPLEIVNLRLRVRIPSEPYAPASEPLIPGDGKQALRDHQQTYFDAHWHTTPIYDREKLHPGDTLKGPALIAEYTSATVLPPGAQLTVDALHNLLITVDLIPNP
jgi:N-methylhydantoinase A